MILINGCVVKKTLVFLPIFMAHIKVFQFGDVMIAPEKTKGSSFVSLLIRLPEFISENRIRIITDKQADFCDCQIIGLLGKGDMVLKLTRLPRISSFSLLFLSGMFTLKEKFFATS